MDMLKNLCFIMLGAVIGAGVLHFLHENKMLPDKKISEVEVTIVDGSDVVNVVADKSENTEGVTVVEKVVEPDEHVMPENMDVPTADWFKDPMCRIIFFATLEGLYSDGVPTEVVDLIIGKHSTLENKVKHNFVFRCDLCHAVYEAFVLYQRRQTFHGSTADSFGSTKIDERIIEDLRNSEPSVRVFAMGSLVQPWIKNKLRTMNLDKAEKQEVMDKFIELAKEGANLTLKLRDEDPDYYNWLFYGTCQACEAIKTVSEEMRNE